MILPERHRSGQQPITQPMVVQTRHPVIVPAGLSGLPQVIRHPGGRLGPGIDLRPHPPLELAGERPLPSPAEQPVQQSLHTNSMHLPASRLH